MQPNRLSTLFFMIATCLSLLTFGASKNAPRTMHAFRGNVDTVAKAEQLFYSDLIGILNEEQGVLAFQDGLTPDVEKATLALMLLMRTRMIMVNGEWQ